MDPIQKSDSFRNLKTQIIVSGKKIPIECPTCRFVLRDDIDVKSVQKESACTECVVNFKHINLEKWEQGWRPTKKESRSKIVGVDN